jgi:hypothetical protein
MERKAERHPQGNAYVVVSCVGSISLLKIVTKKEECLDVVQRTRFQDLGSYTRAGSFVVYRVLLAAAPRDPLAYGKYHVVRDVPGRSSGHLLSCCTLFSEGTFMQDRIVCIVAHEISSDQLFLDARCTHGVTRGARKGLVMRNSRGYYCLKSSTTFGQIDLRWQQR